MVSHKIKYCNLFISTVNIFNDKMNVSNNIVEPIDIEKKIMEMNLHKDRKFILLLMNSFYNDFSKNFFDINVFVLFLNFIKSILITNVYNTHYNMEIVYNLKKIASKNLYNSCLFIKVNDTSLEDYLTTISDEYFLRRNINVTNKFSEINSMTKFNEIFTIYLMEGNDYNIFNKFKEDFKNFLISKKDVCLQKKVFMNISIEKLLYIFKSTYEIINFGIESYYFILLNCKYRKECIEKYCILLSESIKVNNPDPDILSSYEMFIIFNTDDFIFEVINSIYNLYNDCPIVLYNLSLFCSKLKQHKNKKFSFNIIEKIELNFAELENYFLYIGHYHSLLQERKEYKDIFNDFQIKIITNTYKNINLNLLAICYIRFSAGYFTDRSTLLYVNELVKHEFGDEKNIEYLEEFISNHVSLGLNGIGIIICLLNSYTEKF